MTTSAGMVALATLPKVNSVTVMPVSSAAWIRPASSGDGAMVEAVATIAPTVSGVSPAAISAGISVATSSSDNALAEGTTKDKSVATANPMGTSQ